MKISRNKRPTTFDMLNAFEDKLAKLNVNSCTGIKAASEYHEGEVEIYGEDYNERFEDVGGGFSEPGDIVSVADMKAYWNSNRNSDPVLMNYYSFEDWFEDTRDNYMIEASTCSDKDDIEGCEYM